VAAIAASENTRFRIIEKVTRPARILSVL